MTAGILENVVIWWKLSEDEDLEDYYDGFGFLVPEETDAPAKYLHRVLPDLTVAYLEAQEAMAGEVGEDAATFDLADWLMDRRGWVAA